jgi:hypothetical protein
MTRYLDIFLDIEEYKSRLPKATRQEIMDVAISMWENRELDETRREYGVFQAFDKAGESFVNADLAKELELTINHQLEQYGYPIRLAIQQAKLSLPLFRVPTQTYEIVVLDNTFFESMDPMIDWMIENRQELK